MKILLTLIIITSIHFSQMMAQNKISSDVIGQFEQSDVVDCMITMRDQINLNRRTKGLSKEEKALMVYAELKIHSQNNQKEIQDYMSNLGIDFQPFFVFNGLRAKLTEDQVMHIAENFDVIKISFNQPVMIQNTQQDLISLRTDAEWGIQQIGADSVWALGYEGEGVVVAGQDTGYDFDNPLIFDKYRGYSEDGIDHNYNWHDAISEINPLHQDTVIDPSTNPCGLLSPIPCDDNNHGTHTMGTMVGQDTANFIGVAPKAKWMACRNMERGYGTPATYTECFEFFLAPTDLNGLNPDPTKAPHVINNSWACPEIEGCNISNWSIMETVVNNLTAAGTVVVVSAGNAGSSLCGTLNTPAAIFGESFTVGASDQLDSIASFSSIGPVSADGSQRIKPDIVAPGVGVRSIVREEEFATWNGTSMAGPHVAGAVALLISAKPSLAGDVDQIKNILTSTAVPLINDMECNGVTADVVPNFVYGHGRIDILAAVQKVLTISPIHNVDQDLSSVQVVPNPNSGRFSLISDTDKLTNISIYDATGRIINEYEGGTVNVTIDLTNYPGGIYFYRLKLDKKSRFGKIMVE